MSWYSKGSFKQDLLEEIQELLERHEYNAYQVASDMLEVVGHVLSSHDYESVVYNRGRSDALHEVQMKFNEVN